MLVDRKICLQMNQHNNNCAFKNLYFILIVLIFQRFGLGHVFRKYHNQKTDRNSLWPNPWLPCNESWLL